MRDIEWSESALQELDDIVAYIAENDRRAARRVADRIDQTVRNLAEMPIGHQGRVAGTYEMVVTGLPYIIAYALTDRPDGGLVLAILHIIHGAREWRDGEWPA